MTRWWNSLRFRLACLVVIGFISANILLIHRYVEHSELSGPLVQATVFLTAGQVSWIPVSRQEMDILKVGKHTLTLAYWGQVLGDMMYRKP
jgi:hypothetical protein